MSTKKKFNNSLIFRNYICPNPFMYAELQGNGNVSTCCYISHNFGNTNKEELAKIWNNENFQELRRSILDGDYSYCDSSKCAAMQAVLENRKSVKKYQVPYELILKNEIHDMVSYALVQKLPKIISLDDDPTCNLSCPSCRKSLIVLTKEQSQNKLKKQFEILEESGDYLEELWLCGAGDPFASDAYKKLLTTFDFTKLPKLKIRIDTNGVLLNKAMWDTTLKKVQNKINLIAVSVDATNENTYSIVRKGGNFNVLLRNLYFLRELKREKNFIFLIRMIVQKDNFKEMVDFVKLGQKLQVDYVVFSEIQNWGTFSYDEYIEKAVHLEQNKNFKALCNILKSPIFMEPIVNLGNLTTLFHKVNNEK
ncbi:MAG: radical SAM protein [Candidatus Muirbacterium halophilum]|nr:radical SAM protein [Candidatus Muirbacterium halophilum]MCK9477304.1 radical SAM protein [Candidatus Muirbacterium halophilum]